MWATTLPPAKAGTQAILDIGHGRWCIENHGFNEMVHAWHLDHCYRHEENAAGCGIAANAKYPLQDSVVSGII